MILNPSGCNLERCGLNITDLKMVKMYCPYDKLSDPGCLFRDLCFPTDLYLHPHCHCLHIFYQTSSS